MRLAWKVRLLLEDLPQLGLWVALQILIPGSLAVHPRPVPGD
jgi:hypothetical protein